MEWYDLFYIELFVILLCSPWRETQSLFFDLLVRFGIGQWFPRIADCSSSFLLGAKCASKDIANVCRQRRIWLCPLPFQLKLFQKLIRYPDWYLRPPCFSHLRFLLVPIVGLLQQIIKKLEKNLKKRLRGADSSDMVASVRHWATKTDYRYRKREQKSSGRQLYIGPLWATAQDCK